ncbi:MAG: GNAT family N-acetyltransferase [Oscillospiraceae bacterium]|jgi:probable phosphoglycerate mutase|nr:GNAT family N-acetyltransferase [Oscillospiraceae bacterium]
MITTIYLIRHAEAEGNLFRVAHGQYNSNITPRGYRQLSYLRRRFQDVRLDAVCGSDLTRAHTTASALYIPRELAFRPVPLLREIRLGVWEQQSWAELQRLDKQMYIDFNKRPDLWRAEGAETFAQVRDRMLEGVRQIAAEYPGGTVAATSHGAALRTLLGTLQGLSLEEIGRTPHGDNTAVSLLEVEDGTIRLLFRDDNSHVPAAVSTFRRQSWHKDDAATEPGLWFRVVREDGSGREVEGLLDEEVVGRLSVRFEGDDMLRIDGYEMIPALRGQRYGVQLLGQAVQYARKQGRETLVLTCGEELSGYFAQYGFETVDRQGNDVEMKMDLRPAIREIPEPEEL